MKQNRQQEILALIEREVRRAERDTLLLVVEMINERIDARDKLLGNPEYEALSRTMKSGRDERHYRVSTMLHAKNIEDCDIVSKLWDRIIDLNKIEDENK